MHTTDIKQDLLYNPGHPTQYYVTTYMGKASEKEWIYIEIDR